MARGELTPERAADLRERHAAYLAAWREAKLARLVLGKGIAAAIDEGGSVRVVATELGLSIATTQRLLDAARAS